MKHLSPLLILLLICSWSQAAWAQTAGSWVNVSPAGERFTIQMPESPAVKSQQNSFYEFKVDASIYAATSNGVDYTLWSLNDQGRAIDGPPDNEAYLDACAELVWESLLKPLRDQLPKTSKLESYMSYQRELESGRLPPGREYTITLGNRPGLIQIHVAGQQIYVLTVLNADATSAATQRFINSFGLEISRLPAAATVQADPKLIPPAASASTGGGIGPGRGVNTAGGDQRVVGAEPSTGAGSSTDYNRIFSGRDVTEKALVRVKPEPQYTESARKYSVQGTVILRAVFTRTGEVTNISVRQGLPHGLVQRAVAAARQIKFLPASKDGHPVAMYIQLEYNFTLY